MEKTYTLRVNGTSYEVSTEPGSTMLSVLREVLKLTSPRYGCGLEQCGACKIIVDGRTAFSCTLSIDAVQNAQITTLEGLAHEDELHPLQQAFLDENAAQCGYCLSGIINTAKVLLDDIPNPSREQIKSALASNLCRCGAHNRIIRAIERAAKEMANA